ncbi:hypothetical protein AAHS21_17250 [Mycobacterium sp. 050272]|uniref:hypothetical protein n=1 Tax=Mycobacterium sp. 050272 TaxID=3142488 RepID=UPI0031959E65
MELTGNTILVTGGEVAPPRVRTEMDGTRGDDAIDADEFVTQVLAGLSAQPRAGEVVVDAARAVRYAEREGRYGRTLAALNANIHAQDVL